jgi:hypothetical protein
MAAAGVLGVIVAGASCLALIRSDLAPAAAPWTHAHLTTTQWTTLGGVAFATSLLLAWTYSHWFDHLLAGNAAWRGAQFGVVAWIWLGAIAVFLTKAGWLAVPRGGWAWLAVVSGLPTVAYGLAVGLIIGAGKRHDAYTFGLGYGLPDRRSLG